MRSTLQMCIRMSPSTMARLARQVSDTGLAGPRSPQASRPGKEATVEAHAARAFSRLGVANFRW